MIREWSKVPDVTGDLRGVLDNDFALAVDSDLYQKSDKQLTEELPSIPPKYVRVNLPLSTWIDLRISNLIVIIANAPLTRSGSITPSRPSHPHRRSKALGVSRVLNNACTLDSNPRRTERGSPFY